MTIEVIATKRVLEGTSASRRLRHAGKLPAVVYGAGQPAESLELDHNTLFYALKNEAFHTSVLSLVIDGKAQAVLLRDTQLHPWKPQVLHVDFQRINADEKISIKVSLHFENSENSPAVKLGGGKISHPITEVEVRALPGALPQFLVVDLSNIQGGQTVHLSDIVVPEGVELVELARGHNLGVAVASGSAAE